MKITSVLAILACLISIAFAAEGENLLMNTDFQADADGVVTGWQMPEYPYKDDPETLQKLKWGVENVKGADCLMLSSKEFVKANAWWEQIVNGLGGSTYELSVKMKGTLQEGSKYGAAKIGLHFLNAEGDYLSYQDIDVPELSDSWQTVKGKITIPEDAVKMGYRIGIIFEGEMEVFFKEPSLSEVTN